jgi:hypothetical protein
MAGRLATTAHNAGDGTRAQVLKTGHFSDEPRAIKFEIGDGFGHRSSFDF